MPFSRRIPSFERFEPRIVLSFEPVITEFMAANDGFLDDANGSSPDWIEIHNQGDTDGSLEDYRLTDAPDNPALWRFPDVTVPADGYLVVFASGNNQLDPESELHTNFRLSSDGEYLALIDPTGMVVSSYGSPDQPYPEQFSNIAYGVSQPRNPTEPTRIGYIAEPTPGVRNGGNESIFDGKLSLPEFSQARGFYDQAFSVTLTSNALQSTVRYTLDGSAPTDTSIAYDAPITIDQTTTLRAAVFADDQISSDVATQTYIFLDDVIQQDGGGLPATWGTFPFGSTEAQRGSDVPANYDMDPDVVNDPRYRDTIQDDLLTLPTLSIVFDPSDLWDEDTGIYSNPTREGVDWERPVSVELFPTAESDGFHVNAGARIHGGFGRRPAATAKHSFRLEFRGIYGPTELEHPWFGAGEVDRFDTVVLRGNYNYSWARGNRGGSQTGKDYTVVTDRWAADAQQEMGGLAPNGVFVHLYVNGLYWGIYNPTERPDAEFQAEHQGGDATDYDVRSHNGLVDGNNDAWTELRSAVRERPLDMAAVESLLDVDGFIDYMILNQFGGNGDWPQNNWYASRRRAEGERWQFHSWDAEFFFIDVNADRINQFDQSGPGELLGRLRRDAEFRLRFADRVALRLLNGGVLTAEQNIRRLDELAAVVDRAVVGESARWGDAWMDQVFPPRTRDDDWLPRLQELREEYFPRRNQIVIRQYQRAQLYPRTELPELNQFGGEVPRGFELTISHADATAEIYYMADGTDPRLPGGDVRPDAIRFTGQPLTLESNQTIFARAKLDDDWSAAAVAHFTIRRLPGDLNDDGLIGAADIDRLCQAVGSGEQTDSFDLNSDTQVNRDDVAFMLREIFHSRPGDVTLDGIFDSSDLVEVFQIGEYEDGQTGNSVWSDGDWNCDGDFTSSDLVFALQQDGMG